MSKFKVGDKVLILDNSYNKKYIGTVGEIRNITAPNSEKGYLYFIHIMKDKFSLIFYSYEFCALNKVTRTLFGENNG